MSPQPTYKQSPHLDFLNSTMWGVGGSGGYIVAATPHHIACLHIGTHNFATSLPYEIKTTGWTHMILVHLLPRRRALRSEAAITVPIAARNASKQVAARLDRRR